MVQGINLFPTENSLLVGITILMDNNFHVRPTYRIIDFVITDFSIYHMVLTYKNVYLTLMVGLGIINLN